ncbi:unnamed protein product [Pleuronectes platessa]|uniref:Uncharacterized protein n=1 Tax=Pleuronectes platessa TaxID=8262 RepID=A0A9N7U0R3_PLEPL|nr:unnamed protein product [Pleuronectes platessa]
MDPHKNMQSLSDGQSVSGFLSPRLQLPHVHAPSARRAHQTSTEIDHGPATRHRGGMCDPMSRFRFCSICVLLKSTSNPTSWIQFLGAGSVCIVRPNWQKEGHHEKCGLTGKQLSESVNRETSLCHIRVLKPHHYSEAVQGDKTVAVSQFRGCIL